MRIKVLDLETTGLAPPDHGVCEIGWCEVVYLNGWNVLDSTSLLINPGRPIPPEASAVHHLLDEDVAECPKWPEGVGDAFRNDYGEVAAFAAHNAKFDRQWITPELTGDVPWICTYKCALRLWPDAPGHSNQVLRYWLKPAGLPRITETHRAAADTFVTAFLVREMLKSASVADLIAWSAEPALLPRLRMGKYSNGGKGTPWAEVETGYLDWMLKPGKDFDEDLLHSARVELKRRADAGRNA